MQHNICPHNGFPCQKPKLFHITDIAQGKVTQKDVCEDCVSKQPDVTLATMLEFIDFLLKKQVTPEIEPMAETFCPACGLTIADIGVHGKMGCVVCYEVFGDHLKNVLWKAHKAFKHVGKVPKQWEKNNMTIDQMVVKVQTELNQNVHKEQYEQAAAINEKLQKLLALKEKETTTLNNIHDAIANENYELAQSFKDVLNAIKADAVIAFS